MSERASNRVRVATQRFQGERGRSGGVEKDELGSEGGRWMEQAAGESLIPN